MSTLNFCRECNNLLYPTVDRSNQVLLYACKNCNYREEAAHNMVFRNDLIAVSKEQPGVIDKLMTDPTMPRTNEHACPACGADEAVYFQDQSKRTFNRMTLFYVCCSCNKLFTDAIEETTT
ncbi:hypothetical protein V8E36_007481 [Tilletia maclaganii]